MAVIKAIEQDSGISVAYWRMANVHQYFGRASGTGSTLVELEGYVDASARTSGKAPVAFVQVTLNTIIETRANLYPILVEQYAPLEGGTEG